jgi:hypothetical protein
LVFKVGSVLGGDCADEVDILVGVEGGQFLLRGVVLVEVCELEILGVG